MEIFLIFVCVIQFVFFVIITLYFFVNKYQNKEMINLMNKQIEYLNKLHEINVEYIDWFQSITNSFSDSDFNQNRINDDLVFKLEKIQESLKDISSKILENKAAEISTKKNNWEGMKNVFSAPQRKIAEDE